MSRRLFVYGVLQPELARGEAARIVAPLVGGKPAVATGHLFAVGTAQGCYPAFVPDPSGGFVHGQLFDASGVDLAAMDAFEGNEYERRSVAVKPEGGRWSAAEAYCWGNATDGLEPIGGGNFADWLTKTGRRAFGA